MKKVHLIAIGGSAMHNLAIALKKAGYAVSGSDDHIFEPSKSRLKAHDILPESFGWFPEKITSDIDLVIIGMHAKKDNPELIKAQQINIPVQSFPEFLYNASIDKKRIVIAGSHGKTTITSMIMHVFSKSKIDFDYLVGAQLEGFDVMVRTSKNASISVFEGDEYLTSPLDMRPKFIHYRPNILLISGIAWDHINVFPTFAEYLNQFKKVIVDNDEPEKYIIYNQHDEELKSLVLENASKATLIPYCKDDLSLKDKKISYNGKNYEMKIFGGHNIENMAAALAVCKLSDITQEDFLNAMTTFKGASKRLELVSENNDVKVFLDFAHAPSKLQATIEAVKKTFPDYELIASIELHTFSSLNHKFLSHYKNTMDQSDIPVVYFNPKNFKAKKLPKFSIEDVKNAFLSEKLNVFNDSTQWISFLKAMQGSKKIFLIMSSGNYDGVDLRNLAETLTQKK